MSKLDDILSKLENEVATDVSRRINQHISGKAPKQSHSETKQEIKNLMLELVGQDEARPATGAQRNGIVQGLRRTRNKLRIELRKKVTEL